MRARRLLFSALAFFVVAGAWTLRAQTPPPSLGALAAKLQKERGATPDAPPPKVYTNETLPPADGNPAAQDGARRDDAAPAPAPSKAAAASTTDQLAAPVKDEAWWKSKMRELETKYEDDLQAWVNAVRNVDDLRSRLQPSAISLRVVGEELVRARSEASRLDAIAKNSRQAVERHREDARRAGVPPGWLRWP